MAPAKINLHLRVLGRRPDGFHDLQSLFLALSFGDTLHFKPSGPENSLKITMKPLIPVENNIIFKAVSLFRAHTGFSRGLQIRVKKRIPLGSGLGGGSSDAAAALLAMNALAADAGIAGFPLDFANLSSMAASLGSDVPFFLNKTGAAWVEGRGEIVHPLVIQNKLWVVLVNPGFQSITSEAFHLLDQLRTKQNAKYDNLDMDNSIQMLSGAPESWSFTNDFLPAFLSNSKYKEVYSGILDELHAQGAKFAGLSGAGSTCFGVFSDRKKAMRTKENLLKQWNFVKLTFPLAHCGFSVLK